MILAGFKFRLLKSPTLSSGAGLYVYIHQSTGKCFVKAMRNARNQRSKNNYPTPLKELQKNKPSEILIYLAELPKDTKEALFLGSRAVATHLSEKGMLFKKPRAQKGGIYRKLPGEENELYTIWLMTHKETGALFYFEEIKGQDVMQKVCHRMLTFNNYVVKEVVNANRVMYNFAKKFFPMDISDWVIRDLDMAFLTEEDALQHITKLSKQHLEAKEVVMNRVSTIDALYYRNSMLKLPHLSMEEYLQFEIA